jgi:hypothetical protein
MLGFMFTFFFFFCFLMFLLASFSIVLFCLGFGTLLFFVHGYHPSIHHGFKYQVVYSVRSTLTGKKNTFLSDKDP